MLLLGGLAPLLAGLLIILLLPESMRFLVARGAGHERIICAILRHVSPSADEACAFVTCEAAPMNDAGGGVKAILSRPLPGPHPDAVADLFMGLVLICSLVNWVPLLLRDVGFAAQDAPLFPALFPLGTGAVPASGLMDRNNGNAVTAACVALTAATIFAIGLSAHNLALLMVVVLGVRLAMNTTQVLLPLAAAFCPAAALPA